MAVEAVYTTLSGTGNQAYSGFSFLPTLVKFTLSQEGGASDTVTSFTTGWMSADAQRCDTTFGDTTGGISAKFTDKCIVAYRRVSGTITKVFEAEYVSMDVNGGGDYGFTINQTINTQAFQASIEIYA